MLRDEIAKYTELSGNDGWHTPIGIIGAYLDGYEKGLESRENKGGWILFSKELPPKGEKVHISTFGIVTIGERTSEADEKLRLSILEPMNNMYKNVDPYSYQITRWQPLPAPYKAERNEE